MITVENLIKMLQSMPPHAYVILSKDPEGNTKSPLSGLDPGLYVAESTYNGDFYTDDDDYDEDDVSNAVNGVLLWPTN